MKILFIAQPFVIEPLGIMYLSSQLKKAKHETDLITTKEDYIKKIEEFKPDIIAYSVITGSQHDYFKLNNEIKEKFPNIITFMGGPFVTFSPETIEKEKLDIICIGEGEEAITELADKLEKKQDITKIKNLWVKKNGKIYKNPVRPYIKNLDSIEHPDREIIYKYEEQKNNPLKHFIATRGCPYKCTYCFNHQYHDLYKGKGPLVRYRSVDNVIQEVKEVIQKYPTKFVYFQDDTIILNQAWIEEFCKKYEQEIKLPFHCHIRANLLTEPTAKALKQAGCYSVHMAIEAGNSRIRNELLKRQMTNEEILNASKMLRKYGIKSMTQNIIGLPTETLKEALETLNINIACKPTYTWVSIFQPYPGTKLGEFTEEKGLLEEDPNKIEKSFFDKSILRLRDKKKIEHLQKLFAITVDHPWIYKTGLLNILISMPHYKFIKNFYKKAYRIHRKRADYKLYGMRL
jgi:radical SAM superfamily enzyme YgiQ (UPF0313 family)